MVKCGGYDRKWNNCRNSSINDTGFCKYHQYMIDYTPEQMKKLKQCLTCCMIKFFNDYDTCEPCRNHGKHNRYQKKADNKNGICISKKCCVLDARDNGYCGRHQQKYERECFIKEVRAENKKTCSFFNRGCRTKLPMNYKDKRCSSCNDKENKREQKARDNIKERIKNHESDITSICSNCGEEKDNEHFNGEKGNTIRCADCRKNGKKVDDNRRDKRSKYVQTFKPRWYEHKRSARRRNLCDELNMFECHELFVGDCNYCGRVFNGRYNGIDRKDSKIGYIKTNCVSCCKHCNYMKRQLSVDEFINSCFAIVSNLKILDCKYDKDLIPNRLSSDYNKTKTDAIKRNIEFNLSPDQFNYIKMFPCYLCGKKNIIQHENGIDRLDSNDVYNINNCKSCCGTCNFMKRRDTVHDFVRAVVKIALYNTDRIYDKIYNKYKKTEGENCDIFVDIELNSMSNKLIIPMIKDIAKPYSGAPRTKTIII
jgi:hypothetical protein